MRPSPCISLLFIVGTAYAQLQVYDFEQDLLPSYTSNVNQQSHGGMSNIDMLKMAVPGTPGEDYTIFSEVPPSSFSCDGRVDGGYYADAQVGCQPFHVCASDGFGGFSQFSFLCPNGSLFNQEYFICDWWFNVDCARAESFYSLNEAYAAERANQIRGSASNQQTYRAPAPTNFQNNRQPSYGNPSPSSNRNPYQSGSNEQPIQNNYQQPSLPSYGAKKSQNTNNYNINNLSNGSNRNKIRGNANNNNKNVYNNKNGNRPTQNNSRYNNNNNNRYNNKNNRYSNKNNSNRFGTNSNNIENTGSNNYNRPSNKRPGSLTQRRPLIPTSSSYRVPSNSPVPTYQQQSSQKPVFGYDNPNTVAPNYQSPRPHQSPRPTSPVGNRYRNPTQATNNYRTPSATPSRTPTSSYNSPTSQAITITYNEPQTPSTPQVQKPNVEYGVPIADPIQKPATNYGLPQADPITDYSSPTTSAKPTGSYSSATGVTAKYQPDFSDYNPSVPVSNSVDNAVKKPSTGYGVPLADPVSIFEEDKPSTSYGIPKAPAIQILEPEPTYQAAVEEPSTSYGVPLADPVSNQVLSSQNTKVSKPSIGYGVPLADPVRQEEAVAPSTSYGLPQADPISAVVAPSTDYGVPKADPISSSYLPPSSPAKEQRIRKPSTGYGVPLADPISAKKI